MVSRHVARRGTDECVRRACCDRLDGSDVSRWAATCQPGSRASESLGTGVRMAISVPRGAVGSDSSLTNRTYSSDTPLGRPVLAADRRAVWSWPPDAVRLRQRATALSQTPTKPLQTDSMQSRTERKLIPANHRLSPVLRRLLKIVVSPVRVRVSPFVKTPTCSRVLGAVAERLQGAPEGADVHARAFQVQ